MSPEAAPPEATPPAAAPAAPTTGGPKKLLALLPTIGILVGLGAGAFAIVLFVVRPMFPPVGAEAHAKPAETTHKFGRVMALDSVVVNVAQTEGRRYLKATVHLELPEEEKIV